MAGQRRALANAEVDAGGGGGGGARLPTPPPSFLPPPAAQSPPASSPSSRAMDALARAPSGGEPHEALSPNSVYKFDVAKYKDGSYRLVPASARDLVKYTGRVLHHGPTPARKTKVNTVQFDWSAVAFELRVRGARSVGIRLKGDGKVARSVARFKWSATRCHALNSSSDRS